LKTSTRVWRLSDKRRKMSERHPVASARFENGVGATRRRPRGARSATARTPPRAARRLATCVSRRFAVSRTWQMSHIGLALAVNATRSCLATTALAEWMLREPVGQSGDGGRARGSVPGRDASNERWQDRERVHASMRVVRAPRRPSRRGFRPRGARGTGRKKCRFPAPPVRRLSRVARAPLIARPAHHRVVGEAYQGGRVRRAHLAKSLHGAGTRVRLDERAFGVNAGARRRALLRGSAWMAPEELPAGCRRNSWSDPQAISH